MAYGATAAKGGQMALNLPSRIERVSDVRQHPDRARTVDAGTIARRIQHGASHGRNAPPRLPERLSAVPLCAGCRQHEARYGFRVDDADPADARPRTLCFSCFRAELDYRQAVAAQLARGWNGEQVRLPLYLPERLGGVPSCLPERPGGAPFDDTLRALTRRRRRAQIAARHALGE